MEIKKLNETLALFEDKGLTLEQAIQIFADEDKLESEEVKPMKLKTMYDEYECFGDDLNYAVINGDIFHKFIKDMCDEFVQGLPDKFDQYFDTKAMYDDIVNKGWQVVLIQAQRYLENLGTDDFTSIKKFEPTFGDNVYIVELL